MRLYTLFFTVYFLTVAIFALKYRKVRANKDSTIIFVFLGLIYIFLVVFKPLDIIPDSSAYFDRYYYDYSFDKIIKSNLFNRNSKYHMSFLTSLFFWLGHSIGLTYYSFLFIVTSIQFMVVIKYSGKILDYMGINENVFVLLFLYLLQYGYPQQFITFAQSFAMCLGVPAVYFFLKNKKVLAYFLAFISVFFHSAGIANVLILLVLNFSGNCRKLVYFVIWLFLFCIMLFGISNVFLKKISNLINFFGSTLEGSFSSYSEVKKADKMSLRSFLIGFEILILIFVKKQNKTYYKFLNLLILVFAIYSIFSSVAVANRISDVFLFYSIFPIMLFYQESISDFTGIKKSESYLMFLLVLIDFTHIFNVMNIFNI
jgi:hypothetical protein